MCLLLTSSDILSQDNITKSLPGKRVGRAVQFSPISRVIRIAAIPPKRRASTPVSDMRTYAKGSLLVGCKPLVNGLSNAYGYTPTFAAGLVFSIVFCLLLVLHLSRSFRHRKWTSYLLSLAALLELVGWIGRVWNAKCPYNKTAFLMQIALLVIAPLFVAAAIYVCLGYLIILLGARYSLIKPKLYLWIFCASDALALLVQAGGGGLAASETNKNKSTRPGASMMASGIILQLISMSVFVVLFLTFVYRTKAVSIENAGSVTANPVLLWLFATGVSISFVYIRCVYRTIELLQGWDGYLISHEGFFLGLDASVMVIAIGVYIVLDPSVLLPKAVVAEGSATENTHGHESKMSKPGLDERSV